MKIILTGSSGYLGQAVSKGLNKAGYNISGLNRQLLYGPPKTLAIAIKEAGAVINLAGAPVLQRWTEKNREIIYNSRVDTVQNLVKAINLLPAGERPKKIISASAIGIYKTGKIHSEISTDFDDGFLGNLVKDWEAAWDDLPDGISLTIFRIAVVLGKESATIKQLLLPFKLGIGGKIGSGRQPFPFVHETDLVRAFLWSLEDKTNDGIFNLTAPQQITNEEFTRTLARAIHRPAFMPIPVAALRILYGKAAGLLSESPAVIPEALTAKGFKFKFPNIESAVNEIIRRQ
ncbi:MAG: TIGR01777 family oxidoreductase [Prolixibacteraceae bacterium]|nr:TIGR01777 family oxidoreductase [Prolixibacteraceae bacterium]